MSGKLSPDLCGDMPPRLPLEVEGGFSLSAEAGAKVLCICGNQLARQVGGWYRITKAGRRIWTREAVVGCERCPRLLRLRPVEPGRAREEVMCVEP